MSSQDASVFLRIIPPEFRSPEFTISRNNVYRQALNDSGEIVRHLVGQLDEAEPYQIPFDKAARFFGGGGQAALSACGCLTAIANLSVCVVNFKKINDALHRVEERCGQVQQKLDVIVELEGVIDQKVDQLLNMSTNQQAALSDLGNLIMSFEIADVHRALEILEFRSQDQQSKRRDDELLEAANILHKFRSWLAEQRKNGTIPAPARAELLRAEVLILLAGARARCIIGDSGFASKEIEKALNDVRDEADRMRRELLAGGNLQSILSASVHGVVDMRGEYASICSWLDHTSVEFQLRQMLDDSIVNYWQIVAKLCIINKIIKQDQSKRFSLALEYSAARLKYGLLNNTKKACPDAFTKIVADDFDPQLFTIPTVSDADVASLVFVARQGQHIKHALAMCTAIEILGEPANELLESLAPGGSPAIVAVYESI